jgi:hypothetical protein
MRGKRSRATASIIPKTLTSTLSGAGNRQIARAVEGRVLGYFPARLHTASAALQNLINALIDIGMNDVGDLGEAGMFG